MVSICVPTYNGARHLRGCLDSALGQSYPNIEILVVDDASSDETLDIVAGYARLDRRVRLIANPRRLGLVGNWNRCVELALGEWVKFLFQDDLLGPECVARMMAVAHPGGPPLVACRREILFEDVPAQTRADYGRYTAEESLQGVFADETTVSPRRFCEVVVDHLGQNFIGEPTAVLFRRTVFDEFGGFDPDLIAICDLEYWIRVGANTGLGVVPEVLAAFRMHPDNTSSVNVRDRDYRLTMLDPLILLQRFAYHPAFSPLRAAGARRSPPIDFKMMFGERALQVRTGARRSLKADASSDRWAEWAAVVARHPEIGSSPPIKMAQLRRLRRRMLGSVPRLVRHNRTIRSVEGDASGDRRPPGTATDNPRRPENMTR